MDQKNLQNKALLSEIAKDYGTPCFVYCAQHITEQFKKFEEHLSVPHLICYAVKANSNLAILELLANLGSGFDIVSIGELKRVQKAGADVSKVMYSGVAKSKEDICYALEAGIGCFNVESQPELERIQALAESLDIVAPVALRINPDINAQTHPYIATGLKEHKFGIAFDHAPMLLQEAQASSHIQLRGLACHIGSQISTLEPYEAALNKLLYLIEETPEIQLDFINLGGGMGVSYNDNESPMDMSAFLNMLNSRFENLNLQLILEPGRFLTADAGVLLTQIEYIKSQNNKHFAIVNAGMNDLLRPALYEAWHKIIPLIEKNIPKQHYDVVGPVCESADFLGLNRQLAIEAGDILAVNHAGAYGFSMSSHYNSRPKVCEILIKDDQTHLIRERETHEDLMSHEKTLNK